MSSFQLKFSYLEALSRASSSSFLLWFAIINLVWSSWLRRGSRVGWPAERVVNFTTTLVFSCLPKYSDSFLPVREKCIGQGSNRSILTRFHLFLLALKLLSINYRNSFYLHNIYIINGDRFVVSDKFLRP